MNKIVIIDDDPIDHFLIQHIMQDNNYPNNTTYTMDGSLVLDYIEQNKHQPELLPDVIFLDLNMPKFSGWDFLDRFRLLSTDLQKDIQVHILTSSVRPLDKERSTQYPFVKSYISKPLNESVIIEMNKEGQSDLQ
jgi:CheY-like chemotaxis protein